MARPLVAGLAGEVRDRTETVTTAWKQAGLVPVLALLVLTPLSFGAGAVLRLWKDRLFRYFGIGERLAIDTWVLLWAVGLVGVLLAVDHASGPLLILLGLLPLLRLSDLLYTLFAFLVVRQSPRSAARSLSHLLVHYLEVVTAFACLFLVYQQLTDSYVFLIGGTPTMVGPEKAWYFTLTTAATIGHGDVTPNLDEAPVLWLAWAEPMVILLITAFEIPRVFAFSGGDHKPTDEHRLT